MSERHNGLKGVGAELQLHFGSLGQGELVNAVGPLLHIHGSGARRGEPIACTGDAAGRGPAWSEDGSGLAGVFRGGNVLDTIAELKPAERLPGGVLDHDPIGTGRQHAVHRPSAIQLRPRDTALALQGDLVLALFFPNASRKPRLAQQVHPEHHVGRSGRAAASRHIVASVERVSLCDANLARQRNRLAARVSDRPTARFIRRLRRQDEVTQGRVRGRIREDEVATLVEEAHERRLCACHPFIRTPDLTVDIVAVPAHVHHRCESPGLLGDAHARSRGQVKAKRAVGPRPVVTARSRCVADPVGEASPHRVA